MNLNLPGLFECKTRPLTKDEFKLFITLKIAELMAGDTLQGIDKTLWEKGVFPYRAMTKRLEVFKESFIPTLDIGIESQVFCALISDRPGKVVMWAHTLNELFVRNGRQVTLGDWTESFPMGVPTEEEYQRVWELQKEDGSNLIYDFKNWSLPLKEEVKTEAVVK